jgi:hypothetical protein
MAGPGSSSATGRRPLARTVVGRHRGRRTRDGRWMRLGQVMPDDAADGWLTIPGPAPCVAVSGVQLASAGIEPDPPIRELEILGTTAP